MSIEIIKNGIADLVQDSGRFGYQHQGINPTGAMDLNAMKIANALVGNKLSEAIIELNFPASSFYFDHSAIIALSGADFSAKINGRGIPIHQPIMIPGKTELKFSKVLSGSVGYIAIQGGLELDSWLNSFSTNLKAKAGGTQGRYLKKGDRLKSRNEIPKKIKNVQILPWRANVSDFYCNESTIRCLVGHEFDWLTKKSQADLTKGKFTINPQSDRMGYRLRGIKLKQSKKQELLSTAVTNGTIQVLPTGELIVLMADHQTTGGYPRVGHVITADRSTFVQLKPNEKVCLAWVTEEEAESEIMKQFKSMQQLQLSCLLKLNEWFNRV